MNYIRAKYINLMNRIYRLVETRALEKKIIRNNTSKNIYLFSNPIHSNLGDQAQTYCILRWFREQYPDYNAICVPQRLCNASLLETILQRISPEDKIFVHSGYLIYDPHPELPFICEVISKFKGHQIIVLPQTINLEDSNIKELVTNTFNSHGNVKLLCRDEISYQKATKDFNRCNIALFPDFVTSIIGNPEFRYNTSRNGILFMLRNDGEKYYSDEKLSALMQRLSKHGISVDDTTIAKSSFAWKSNREKLIKKTLRKMASAKLIITDRYHGLIFSQITSTPVIVIRSNDHKLSSGVDWFRPDIFKNNVTFANSLDEAYNIAEKILQKEGITPNPPYFYQTFFNQPM